MKESKLEMNEKKRMKRVWKVGCIALACCLFQSFAAAAQQLKEIHVALSAFQNVNSIYVGIAKGFYEKEGLKLIIQNTDWPGANELLIGEHADIATSSDADIVLQNAR